MRYFIGIDLGTTNSSVSYVDIKSKSLAITPFFIPQLTEKKVVKNLSSLPSFCYLPAFHEIKEDALALPWDKKASYVIGELAKEQGGSVPSRLIASAKSFLCCQTAKRKDKILPIHALEENIQISPVETSARYLKYIKDAWNYELARQDPEAVFEEQDIILTVPASFDEVAKTLTVQAAKLAGLTKITLLEEPMSALYAWLAKNESSWKQKLVSGDAILVVDVGGGTTDFSLVAVEEDLSLKRMHVGNHLLLGGDNMDRALTFYLENKLANEHGKVLSPLEWEKLLIQTRKAKETLLDPKKAPDSCRVSVQGAGSKVVEGSFSVVITKQEVCRLLKEGFFEVLPWNEALNIRKKEAVRSMGLPYEEEPSITKHLACFLNRSKIEKAPAYVLFNGGVMKAECLQQQVVDCLHAWFPGSRVQILQSPSLDLAVCQGASYFAKAKSGLGEKIKGGLARGFYLEVAAENDTRKALALLPYGSGDGAFFQPEETFLLSPNEPVKFQTYTSSTRLQDAPGDQIDILNEEMQPLPPLYTMLHYGKTGASESKKIKVRLKALLTPVGTLELSLQSVHTNHCWNLEFQLKTESGQENSIAFLEKARKDQTFDAEILKKAKETVKAHVSSLHPEAPKKIIDALEKTSSLSKKQWPASFLRSLADEMLLLAKHRKNSKEHLFYFWNLLGFFLRPGFGSPLDDSRIKQFWKVFLEEKSVCYQEQMEIQRLICLRRAAGGLNKGQQQQAASDILSGLFNARGKLEVKKGGKQLYEEKIKALGSFELLDISLKTKLGNALLEKILQNDALGADYFALGRIGARNLTHGTFAHLVPKESCIMWIEALLKTPMRREKHLALTLGLLACRSEDKAYALPREIEGRVMSYFSKSAELERIKTIILNQNTPSLQFSSEIFGDSLPPGLFLQTLN